MNENGCSTCKKGQERYEMFTTRYRGNNVKMYQYDYRADDGSLFSCVAPSLEECRRRRDNKLFKQQKQ